MHNVGRNCPKPAPVTTLAAAEESHAVQQAVKDPRITAPINAGTVTESANNAKTNLENLISNPRITPPINAGTVTESTNNGKINEWGPLHHDSLTVEKKKKPLKNFHKTFGARGGVMGMKKTATVNLFAPLNDNLADINSKASAQLQHAGHSRPTFHVGNSSIQGEKIWTKKKKRKQQDMPPITIAKPKEKGIILVDGPTRNSPHATNLPTLVVATTPSNHTASFSPHGFSYYCAGK